MTAAIITVLLLVLQTLRT